MKLLRIIALATGVAMAMSALPTPAQAACQPTPDQASVGIRALQTELMVAGLKCSAEQWNMFTRQFKTTIKSNADRLQTLFRKSYGKAGAERMNAFVTQLANDASQRSNGAAEEVYCKVQADLFKEILALSGAELERFAAGRSLAVASPVALCSAEPVSPTVQAAVSPAKTAPVKHKAKVAGTAAAQRSQD